MTSAWFTFINRITFVIVGLALLSSSAYAVNISFDNTSLKWTIKFDNSERLSKLSTLKILPEIKTFLNEDPLNFTVLIAIKAGANRYGYTTRMCCNECRGVCTVKKINLLLFMIQNYFSAVVDSSYQDQELSLLLEKWNREYPRGSQSEYSWLNLMSSLIIDEIVKLKSNEFVNGENGKNLIRIVVRALRFSTIANLKSEHQNYEEVALKLGFRLKNYIDYVDSPWNQFLFTKSISTTSSYFDWSGSAALETFRFHFLLKFLIGNDSESYQQYRTLENHPVDFLGEIRDLDRAPESQVDPGFEIGYCRPLFL